ncbi:MAG: response regulator transcription factor [Taibaiella sp.]|nr:response regulator transcription factor [Taibaiella sp.]
MKNIRYIVADDHAIFRQGIKYSLETFENLFCVGEAGSGEELMDVLKQIEPDVILMDLKMPGMDGMAATTEVRRLYPAVKIIVLTMYDDEQYIMHMLDIGVNAYLVKNTDPAEIAKAMYSVIENEYYFSDMVSKAMLKNLVQKRQLPVRFEKVISLNERETEILKLICKELTTAEIADKVFLSQRTVEGIRAGMLEKVGVRNTAGLVLYAARAGLAD